MSKARQMVQYDRALGLLFSIFVGGDWGAWEGGGKTIWGGKVEEEKKKRIGKEKQRGKIRGT